MKLISTFVFGKFSQIKLKKYPENQKLVELRVMKALIIYFKFRLSVRHQQLNQLHQVIFA